MNVDNLIHMANRIGEFYQSYPDHDEAIEGIANHIAKFWEPRMRRAILAALDGEQANTLAPLVLEALTQNKEKLLPDTPNAKTQLAMRDADEWVASVRKGA